MKNNKLRIACLLGLLLVFPVIVANAQESQASTTQSISPEKQALVKELLELVNSKRTIDAMLAAQVEQMEKELPDAIWQEVSGMKELKSLTTEQREEVRSQVASSWARSGKRTFDLIQGKLDFDKIVEDISFPLYDKYFTESELRDMVAFYKSPTGIKILDVMPKLLVESMDRATKLIVPKLTEIMKQMREEEMQRMTDEIQAIVKTKATPAKPAGQTPHRRRRH